MTDLNAMNVGELTELLQTVQRAIVERVASEPLTYEDLPDVFRAIRMSQNLTQADLADMCGVTRTSITNFEAGRQFKYETARLMIKNLGYRDLAFVMIEEPTP